MLFYRITVKPHPVKMQESCRKPLTNLTLV
jgi:hypothetical protein